MHALAYSMGCSSNDSVRVSAVLFFLAWFLWCPWDSHGPHWSCLINEGDSPSTGCLSVRHGELCWTKRPPRWGPSAGVIYPPGNPRWGGRPQLGRRESASPDSSHWESWDPSPLLVVLSWYCQKNPVSSEGEHVPLAIFSYWARIIFCWVGETQVFLPLFLPS